MKSLVPGIVTFFDPRLSRADRFQVSLGTGPASDSRRYEAGAMVPNAPWRKPTARECRTLTATSLSDHYGSAITVVSIPQFLLQPFETLCSAAREGQSKDEIYEMVGRGGFIAATNAVINYLHEHFRPASGAVVEEIKGGIRVNPPCQPTTTDDPESKELVGLHLDNWSRYPMERRAVAPNRMTVNIGCQDRFLLFINLPIAEMYRKICHLSPDRVSIKEGGTMIARVFMTLFPSYPVVRLRIHRGEAYVAPTENVVHDGSTLEMTTADISLALRGRIALMPQPRSGGKSGGKVHVL